MNLAGSEEIARSEDTLVQGGSISTNTGTLISGQTLVRGSVLGRITASGKLTLAASAAGDGSDAPVGILVHDIDASAGDEACQFYNGGDFNSADLTWGVGYTDAAKSGVFDGSPIKIVTPV